MGVYRTKGKAYWLGMLGLFGGAALMLASVVYAARGSASGVLLLMAGGALSGAGLAALAARLIGLRRGCPRRSDRPG